MFVWLLRLSFDHPSSLIIDHFCKYLHIYMYIHVKAIMELFSISYLRSHTGDSVFPDLGTDESLDETVESSRRRHQRRYLDAQLDLIEGIVVSIALLSTFDIFCLFKWPQIFHFNQTFSLSPAPFVKESCVWYHPQCVTLVGLAATCDTGSWRRTLPKFEKNHVTCLIFCTCYK